MYDNTLIMKIRSNAFYCIAYVFCCVSQTKLSKMRERMKLNSSKSSICYVFITKQAFRYAIFSLLL